MEIGRVEIVRVGNISKLNKIIFLSGRFKFARSGYIMGKIARSQICKKRIFARRDIFCRADNYLSRHIC